MVRRPPRAPHPVSQGASADCVLLVRRCLQSVTLHTTLGDLKIEVYCDEVPRTSENFLALAASGRYDNTKFHRCVHKLPPTGHALRAALLTPDVNPADRNIKGFMIQVRWRAWHCSLASC
jgi:hypothetical protein